VWVAYLSLLRTAQPQLLVYYRPNPDIPSIIDLVVQNIGGGVALGVKFSEPLPISWFGIERPDGEGSFVSEYGFPAIAPGQQYVFAGGQYAGLHSRLGAGLPITASFSFRNPLGMMRKRSEMFTLGLEHMKGMPTRTSANQAIVDALKGPNKTTLQEIRNELRGINQKLALAAKMQQPRDDEVA
jgi:hypothetical protein